MNYLSSFFGNLGKFWQTKPAVTFIRANFVLILFQIALVTFYFNHLPPEIPLYFSRPWGEAWLAGTSSIFFLPFFSILVTIINYLLALYFFQKKTLLSQLLVIFSSMFTLLSTASLIQIIHLVV